MYKISFPCITFSSKHVPFVINLLLILMYSMVNCLGSLRESLRQQGVKGVHCIGEETKQMGLLAVKLTFQSIMKN